MPKKKFVEYVELDKERKWKYLSKYYEIASKFHQIKDKVVSEDEIEHYIKNFKEKPLPKIRKEIKLKQWSFKLDENDEGVGKEYYSFDHREDDWEKVNVPHSCRYIPPDPVRYGRTIFNVLAQRESQYWDIYKADYCTWYKTRLSLDDLNDDQIAYLSFDSINLLSDVWVNENPVMMSHLGLFPFKMEITEEIDSRKNREAVIALKVTSNVTNVPYFFYNGIQASYCNPPYTDGTVKQDWLDSDSSGIAGDATLSILNRNHIEDVFIFTDDITEDMAFLTCRLELRNETWQRFCGNARIEISKWHPEQGSSKQLTRSHVEVLHMNDAKLDIKLKVQSPELWTMDTPNLYLAHIVLEDEKGNEIDDVYENFGIRTIKMLGSHFYLNGKKIILRGTHDLANYFNDSLICPSDRSIVMDILLHRKMGATCSRWPSDIRMHYKKIAQYADQIGFMISWAGYFEMWITHPEMELYAKRDAKAMVRSLRNCPSIIVWEMGDEPLLNVHHYRRFKWYEQIYKLVEEEDISRPIIPAGGYCNDLVDLIVNYPDKDLPVDEKRRKILKEYPLFGFKLAPWDYHYCPYLPPGKPRPVYEIINTIKHTLGGERATIFTEFNIDGMPKLEKIIDIYGKFRWSAPGIMPIEREPRDVNYYGKEVNQYDWKQTQAAQAMVLSSIICYLRESPEHFAGFYFPTLVDVWTFYWGVVDANFNAKLSYFVVQSCYGPVFVSGLHGNTVLDKNSGMDIKISNFEEDISNASLKLIVKDENKSTIKNKEFKGINIKGKVTTSTIAKFDLKGIPSGLYSIEYYLYDDDGSELNKSIELFFIQ